MFWMPKKQVDRGFLRMALVGYEAERQKIEAKIREIRALLNGPVKHTTHVAAVEEVAPVRKRRKMSAAARKRIGDATRKRWADLRKAKKRNAEVPF